jgi:hypothetical protein
MNTLTSAVTCLATVLSISAPAAAEELRWGQDLPTSAGIAMTLNQPLVLYFIGNDEFDDSLFGIDGFDVVAGKAQFVFVGADMNNQTTPDQIDIEKQYHVTTFPTLLLLEPMKSGTSSNGSDQYTLKERVRCDSRPMEECSKIIGNAIRAGS